MGIASYNKESFTFTINKIREEWDAIPMSKNVHMAAATESATASRICFKFQTNECTRKGCPYTHKIRVKNRIIKLLRNRIMIRNSRGKKILGIIILKGQMVCTTVCR